LDINPKGEYLTSAFLLLLCLSFIMLEGMLYFAANQTYLTTTANEAEEMQEQIEKERQTITAFTIFLNNFQVSILLIIPLIGLFYFGWVWNNTAIVIGMLSKAYGINPAIYISTITILVFPEIAAYTVMVAENIYVTLLALTRGGAMERLKHQTWKSLTIYTVLLFVGAVLEMMQIA